MQRRAEAVGEAAVFVDELAADDGRGDGQVVAIDHP